MFKKPEAYKLFFIFQFLLFALPQPSQAAPNIHAWLENNRVIVMCVDNDNKAIPDAFVTIYDSPQKNRLISGKPNSDGYFSFEVPNVIREGHDLVIDVNDGRGQAREWSVTAAELYAASALTVGFDQAATSEQMPPVASNSGSAQNSPVPAQYSRNLPNAATITPDMPASSAGISTNEIKEIMQTLLQEQLTPIKEKLQTNANQSNDIWLYAGIGGWVFGFASLLGLILARRKN